MAETLLWLIRGLGFSVFAYGGYAFVQALYWGRVGLHMRTVVGESFWAIQYQTYSFIIHHEESTHRAILFILVGGLIVLLSFLKAPNRK